MEKPEDFLDWFDKVINNKTMETPYCQHLFVKGKDSEPPYKESEMCIKCGYKKEDK